MMKNGRKILIGSLLVLTGCFNRLAAKKKKMQSFRKTNKVTQNMILFLSMEKNINCRVQKKR